MGRPKKQAVQNLNQHQIKTARQKQFYIRERENKFINHTMTPKFREFALKVFKKRVEEFFDEYYDQFENLLPTYKAQNDLNAVSKERKVTINMQPLIKKIQEEVKHELI